MSDAAPADGCAVPGASRSHTARTEANSRLTATAGTVVFFLLAVQGVTILRIHQLVGAHVVVGFALLGPFAVKVGSTGWRFARYYSGDADYTRAGPPRPLLRLLAPLVVTTTLAVFVTGIGLLFVTPGRGSALVLLHKVTFIGWFGVMAVHVLAYVIPAWRWCLADLTGHGPPSVIATRRARQLLVGAALAAGLSLGAVGLGWAHPWVSWFAMGRP